MSSSADGKDMPHVIVKWRPVLLKDVQGSDFESFQADIIDSDYSGRLLSEMIQMKPGKHISFADAVRLAWSYKQEAFNNGQFGNEPGQYGWYSTHFVEWIASLGYHIEITGDEFELSHSSQLAV